MTPTYDELLQGATTWQFRERGLTCTLSHHDHRRGDEHPGDRPHPGTWAFYLIVPEQMFPHRWTDFACVRRSSGHEQQGPAWNDDWFHSGITWSSSEPYYDQKTSKRWDATKVGCDYNHYWDEAAGYPDTFRSVKADAEAAVTAFFEANPDHHIRSDYSGRWDIPERFYTAINGSTVHVEDVIPDGWDQWQRAPEVSA